MRRHLLRCAEHRCQHFAEVLWVGLPLTAEGERDESAPDIDRKSAVLALTERLTGIPHRISPARRHL
ncbi:DUF6461 domain-containing protein [Streptomyces crystallinus]|uniref:DUF6461 domain-containing protein n=1 Tax=Streptomyces crystallinus TaxID=68191 RepID=UPI0031DBD632